MKSLSVKRKSLTSAWRRSMSSTRKTPGPTYYVSDTVAAAAVTVTAAAAAAAAVTGTAAAAVTGTAAAAAAAGAAGAAEAALGVGGVVAVAVEAVQAAIGAGATGFGSGATIDVAGSPRVQWAYTAARISPWLASGLASVRATITMLSMVATSTAPRAA